MKATITAVNRTKTGYSFLVDIEGKVKGFDFPEDVKNAGVNQTIRDYLQETIASKARLPELRADFVGKVYEL